MEIENLILRIYHETGKWIADCVGTGPGVGGGHDLEQPSPTVAEGPVMDDQLTYPCQLPDAWMPCVDCPYEQNCPFEATREEDEQWTLM